MKKSSVKKYYLWIILFPLLSIIFAVSYVLNTVNNSVDLGIYRLIRLDLSLINPKIMLVPVGLAMIYMTTIAMHKMRTNVMIRFYVSQKDITVYISTIVKIFLVLFIGMIVLYIGKMAGNLLKLRDTFASQKEIMAVRELLSEEKTVVHAAGLIDGYSYTNSKEALVNCYETGNRVCELDFLFTKDDKLVCAHDGEEAWAYGVGDGEILTEKEFLQNKFLNKFTTMGMDTLADFMREHKDFYVVTDIKDDNIRGCQYIASNYPDLINNFIIQIYHITEYQTVKNIGFDYMIYTLYEAYESEIDPLVLEKNVKEYDLVGVTFWESWLFQKAGLYETLRDTGVLMFVHTVNQPEDIERDVQGWGVLVYTDNTDNDWMR